MLVKVALSVEPQDGSMGYYYKVPQHLEEKISLGARVEVPFGKTAVIGYIIAIESNRQMTFQIKPIKRLIDEVNPITRVYYSLGLACAKKYFTNPYHVYELMFPKRQKGKKQIVYTLNEEHWEGFEKEKNIIDKLLKHTEEAYISEIDLADEFPKETIRTLVQKKYLNKETIFLTRVSEKKAIFYKKLKAPDVFLNRAKKQVALLALFSKQDVLAKKDIEKAFSSPDGILRELVKKGYLEKLYKPIQFQMETLPEFANNQAIALNEEQQVAVCEVIAHLTTFQTYLLHGITGSGKTEVYINLIKKVLSQGKNALVLVPEIALTPQLYSRFYAYFGNHVFLWHSGLSDAERNKVWQATQTGEARVLIGVRSVVFVPLKNMGIIIVDEAHDGSYKQSEPEPRYNAIDMAEYLAKLCDIPLILGSATPTVEMTWQAKEGVYKLLSLTSRAKAVADNDIILYDMKQDAYKNDGHFIGSLLQEKINSALANHEQIVLYLNRRGYATYVYCMECGEKLTCPHCQRNLVYHKGQGKLKCHYCDEVFPLETHCKHCGKEALSYQGYGTEQVEEHLYNTFDNIKICRMDYETTREKNAYFKKLSAFQKGEYDVLLGTQMIGKGLDNENVTLVGIINADMGLMMFDYKARERVFAQLLQVSGRAGRGNKKGEVIIQTYQPEEKLFSFVQNKDYMSFYEDELEDRRLFDYPPFTQILRLIVSDFDEAYLKEVCKLIEHDMKVYEASVSVLGPGPCPIAQVRGRYRYQFIIKGDKKVLYQLGWKIRQTYKHSKKRKTYRLALDLMPESIL